MIAVANPSTGTIKFFDDLTLKELRSGPLSSKIDLTGVAKVGLMVRDLSEDAVRVNEAQDLDLHTDEKSALAALAKSADREDIWLISESSFFKNLPYDIPRDGSQQGLIHASLVEKARELRGTGGTGPF